MTIEQQTKLNQLVDQFASDADVIEMVQSIESSAPTTQNHYGRYLVALQQICKDKITMYVMAHAMIKVGANRDGIASALRIIG